MKAHLSDARISPKKISLVAGLVRGMSVKKALTTLEFTPKKGAKILAKVIRSAAANAENNFKQNPDKLYVKEIVVAKAATLKRSVPISRGRMHPILKRNAHIHVVVDVLTDTEAPVKRAPKKKSAKTEAPSNSNPAETAET